jgi:arsenate reductase
MSDVTVYGIPNCDTMKKARTWLSEHDIEYTFHDYKKQGITKKKINEWLKSVEWEILLNRRGMMWRKVPDEIKQSINKTKAIELMLETPSIIKRPVLEARGKVTVGFNEATYQELFN